MHSLWLTLISSALLCKVISLQASTVVELSTKLPKANRKCKYVPPGSVVALLEEFDVSTLG